MRLLRFIFTFALITLNISIMTSCNSRVADNNVLLTGKIAKTENSNVISFETERLKSLIIDLKNADVTFVNWGKKEVRIETETIITGDKSGKFDTSNVAPKSYFENDVLTINETANKNKSIAILNKIKINAPCEISDLDVTIQKGSFTSTGDLITKAKIRLNEGNADISRFQGDIDAKVETGNISLSSGRLKGSSNIYCQSGNIEVKTEILNSGTYKFEIETGNVEVKFPARLTADFSCQGNVVSNEFKSTPNNVKIIASSRQGSIQLKKY